MIRTSTVTLLFSLISLQAFGHEDVWSCKMMDFFEIPVRGQMEAKHKEDFMISFSEKTLSFSQFSFMGDVSLKMDYFRGRDMAYPSWNASFAYYKAAFHGGFLLVSKTNMSGITVVRAFCTSF